MFDKDTSVRLAAKSDRGSDTYRNADGSLTKVVSSRPVNFRAKDGSYRPIDTKLVKRADGRLQMAANSVQVSLSGGSAARGAADDLVSVTLDGGQSIAYSVQGAATVAPAVSGSTAVYRELLPNTDVEVSAYESGEKENIVLKSRQAANSWLFPLRLQGVTPRLEADGRVAFLDATGVAVAWIPRGYMQDSHVELPTGEPTTSDAVSYELVESSGGWALRVTADRAWLQDPARVYPVRVDPQITTYTTTDAFVDNDTSTPAGTQNGTSLAVGYDNESAARPYIHFGNFATDLAGRQITAVTLRLWHTWSWDCTTHLPVTVHAVTQNWTDTALGTSTLPGPTINSTALGTLTITDNYPACTNTGGDRSKGAWRDVALSTATFSSWATGGANYGLSLRASETDPKSWKRFTSSDFSAGAYEPRLIVTYNDVPQVTARSTTPATACVTGTGRPSIQTLTPTLSATVTDTEGTAQSVTFEWWQVGGSAALGTATKTAVASGATTSHTLVAGNLVEGGAYQWRVKTTDGLSTSPWSSFCEFSVYTTYPPVAGCQNGIANDFNGDGVKDVAISDPLATVNSLSEAGAIQVADGATGAVTTIHQDLAEVAGAAEASDRFGQAIVVYDANRDGCADLAVGSPYEDNGSVIDAGEVQILFGSPSGLGKSASAPAVTYTQGVGGVPGTQVAYDYFGFSLAADTTSTGESFLVVGAPGDDVSGYADAGTVHYFRGGLKLAFDQTNGGGGNAEPDDRFGYAVAASPYHIAASAPGESKDANTQYGGQVNVYSHTLTNNLPTKTGAVNQDSSGVADAMESGDTFGKSIALAPFWPAGDSILAVGVPGEDSTAGADAGMVHQFRMSGTSLTELVAVNQDTAGISGSSEAGDLFGEKVALVNTNPSAAPTAATLQIAIGAPGEELGTTIDAGTIRVFAAGAATITNDVPVERAATGNLPGTPGARELIGNSLGVSATEFYVASPYLNKAAWALPWTSLAADTVVISKTWTPGVAGMPSGVIFGPQVG
ncbi:hypothetical protein Cci01nite_16330 [Catellatospora citrea]|uniref:Fibronectin type-III domain-containing protein n=1 Tax=Catellatospora citrea TaxID=53366 RepID=A0A8J3K9D4_9ACTN|nr:hypothetical protein Cci01nite_16330 [Catellatospora citrea]